ncbi:hypothetical protein GLAREA_07608 [Glarea lozoyensis ATCC 20868]|uniref:Ecp2 effector protein domain-containing protein n=1 Tax=Glarea lozoyensis (strain ATCC 20868 / MF5171) TaxID=1116229 RepID=S3D3U7_GLAL2|nr:uncharacterized protein GLAREA_07608 [Glarea lozoyensis ATCC 20868]EPE32475.1 hypothetical protein GLAREA_07608 [Glarea lozoyensis ATCC 20868]
MQFVSTLLGFLGFAALALGLPATDNSETAGADPAVTVKLPYPVEPFTFNGTIDGHEVYLVGSIDEQLEHMEKTYPDFDRNNFQAVRADIPETKHETRSVNNKVGMGQCCDEPQMQSHGWNYVSSVDISFAAAQLAGYEGGCPVQPHRCVFFTRSGRAGIHLCNDNTYFISPSCKYLSSYAVDIRDHCGKGFATSNGLEARSCGQQFDTDGYNVVVVYEI